ncbi:MAG: hypothetical protein AAFR47_15595, partial [Pseudomonadota bacterium]
AGAIAIDLLPAVLVFVLLVVQAAIRGGREPVDPSEAFTLAELRAAMAGLREVEVARIDIEKTVSEEEIAAESSSSVESVDDAGRVTPLAPGRSG